jgi:hypothetical protein
MYHLAELTPNSPPLASSFYSPHYGRPMRSGASEWGVCLCVRVRTCAWWGRRAALGRALVSSRVQVANFNRRALGGDTIGLCQLASDRSSGARSEITRGCSERMRRLEHPHFVAIVEEIDAWAQVAHDIRPGHTQPLTVLVERDRTRLRTLNTHARTRTHPHRVQMQTQAQVRPGEDNRTQFW